MPVLSSKAVGQIGGAVELAAAHVDVAAAGLAKGDDAGIQPMDQRAQRQKIQITRSRNVESVFHDMKSSLDVIVATPAFQLSVDFCSNTTEGRKAAVHRHNDSGDKLRSRRHEPQDSPQQILRLAESSHGSVLNDGMAASS